MEGTFVQPLKDQPNAVQIYAIQAAALGKKKNRPGTGHEGPDVYSATLSLNSALDGGGWSTPRFGRFTPGKDLVPVV